MPVTKNFALRIEILDELLGGLRKFSFEDLKTRLNERLEYAGHRPISEKTLYNDLKFLREDKSLPIHRPTRHDPTYYYTEKRSIKDLPFSDEELDYLKQAAEVLKKAAPFMTGGDIELIVNKLENKIHTNIPDRLQVIQFEDHTLATGDHWLESLFTAIKQKAVLRLVYKTFKDKEAIGTIFHPYLLKEYRNRWFLFGRVGRTNNLTIRALDRIVDIRNSAESFIENDLFDPDSYFRHLVGVSIPLNGRIESVEILVKRKLVPYIKSKPVHKLQEILKEHKNGDIIIRIPLYINHELKSVLLGYGSGIQVRRPDFLRNELIKELIEAQKLYRNEDGETFRRPQNG